MMFVLFLLIVCGSSQTLVNTTCTSFSLPPLSCAVVYDMEFSANQLDIGPLISCNGNLAQNLGDTTFLLQVDSIGPLQENKKFTWFKVPFYRSLANSGGPISNATFMFNITSIYIPSSYRGDPIVSFTFSNDSYGLIPYETLVFNLRPYNGEFTPKWCDHTPGAVALELKVSELLLGMNTVDITKYVFGITNDVFLKVSLKDICYPLSSTSDCPTIAFSLSSLVLFVTP